MSIAEIESKNATCNRLHVGCVLAKDDHILTTGYNTSLPGHPTCDEADHLMYENGCKRTVHAETKAILKAARYGIALEGATAYVTAYPCPDCMKSLNEAGIKVVYYKDMYHHRYENAFHEGMEVVPYVESHQEDQAITL